MASTASSLTQSFDRSPGLSRDRRSRSKISFMSRLFQALVESRQREADRVIASVIARQGGKFTDLLERQIERKTF